MRLSVYLFTVECSEQKLFLWFGFGFGTTNKRDNI